MLQYFGLLGITPNLEVDFNFKDNEWTALINSGF